MLWLVMLVGCGISGQDFCADLHNVECDCGSQSDSVCESPAARDEYIDETCSSWEEERFKGVEADYWQCVLEEAEYECKTNVAYTNCCEQFSEVDFCVENF